MADTPVFSIIGWSGAGKTTLLERLLPALKSRGLRVAVVKEIPKAFDVDVEGTDTWRFSRAGADCVAIANPKQSIVFMNYAVGTRELIESVSGVDMVITEGHHDLGYPQLEVFRAEVSGTLRCPCAGNLIAVITQDDIALEEGVRRFAFGEIDALADFLVRRGGGKKEQ